MIGPFSAYNQVPFLFCFICSTICLLYFVIPDFVQKDFFLRYRQ